MRQVDPHSKAGMKPGAYKQYQKGVFGFLCFLAWYQLNPYDAIGFDDFLIEWKNDNCWGGGDRNPRKSDFEMALAGIEKAIPSYAGQLTQSHRILSSWRAAIGVSHTVPMSRPWVILLSTWMSQMGQPRIGATLIIQYVQCLRPSEAINLFSDHYLLPEEFPPLEGRGVLFLGPRGGTKAGRPQHSLIDDPLVLFLLRHFRRTIPKGQRLCTMRSLTAYSEWIARAAFFFGLAFVGWTPHSPRAGRASDLTLANHPFWAIRELGRWQCDRTLRRYLDIVAVAGGELALKLQSYLPLVRSIEADFTKHFRLW